MKTRKFKEIITDILKNAKDVEKTGELLRELNMLYGNEKISILLRQQERVSTGEEQ